MNRQLTVRQPQTPASCSNIALHNLYPGEIDLVISGPNRKHNPRDMALTSAYRRS